MKKPAAKSYALRIDAQLVKPLQELKKQNRRSLNAEINAALETWIGQLGSTDAAPEAAAVQPVTPEPAAESKPKRKSARKHRVDDGQAPAATSVDV